MDDDERIRQTLSDDARIRFEALYERQASWDVDRPQPAFVRLAQQGMIRGEVLDVGCGSGDNALYLAALGHPTWGIDIVGAAIGRARAKARERGLPHSRLLVADALALDILGMQFDTVIDSGLFHALSDPERTFFVQSLREVLRPDGLYHMLGFSDQQPGETGPRRLTQREIRATFSQGWQVVGIEHERFETNIHDGGAHAWLATVRRSGQ
jgi:SAM-dependent methyltransferase